MIIRLTIDLDYDSELIHGGSGDKEAADWFFNEVLGAGDGSLILHSNVIGDDIGTVTVVGGVGDVVVTTDDQGNAVAVTRQDTEGRVTSVIWERSSTN